jgi:hypothetical protein
MKPVLLVLALVPVLAAAQQPAKKVAAAAPAARLAMAPAVATAEKARVSREALAGVERSIDSEIRSWSLSEPYDLLGFTRGVYLPGYGAVLTTEVNLVITLVNPFMPPPKGARLLQLKEKKQKRLASMRVWMRQALINAGAALDQVPPEERVVFAMTLFYQSFEDRGGLPGQIVIEAPRQALADFKAGRISTEQLDAAIQSWEL